MTAVKDDMSGVLVCEWQRHWCWWCDEGYDDIGIGDLARGTVALVIMCVCNEGV